MSKAKGGKSKVKPVLFDALHMDAGQRIKWQYLQENDTIQSQCTLKPEIRTINWILGEKGESKTEMFTRLTNEKVG